MSWLGSKPSSESTKRNEYHLNTKGGDHQSRTMLLNGVQLELAGDGCVPVLNLVPSVVDSIVHLAPTSIVFVVLPRFEAKACS